MILTESHKVSALVEVDLYLEYFISFVQGCTGAIRHMLYRLFPNKQPGIMKKFHKGFTPEGALIHEKYEKG